MFYTLEQIVVNKAGKIFKRNFHAKGSWCYFTDSNNQYSNWHNHYQLADLTSVLYLKTPQNCGIIIYQNNTNNYIDAKENDLLFIDPLSYHLPIISPFNQRITVNIELGIMN